MKNAYLMISCLFIILFVAVLAPKPAPRIERIALQYIKTDTNVIFSSSILDHVSKCSDYLSVRERIDNNYLGIADGGLTIEEAYLLSKKLRIDKNKITTIFGLYSFNQPFNYQIGNHKFYTDDFTGGIITKANWSFRDPLKIDGKEFSPTKFNAYVAKNYGSLCKWQDEYKKVKNSIFNSIYKHKDTLNLEFIEHNISTIKNFSKNNIIILPPKEILSQEQYKEILKFTDKISSENIKLIELELEDYDEPWCLCGHLSKSGITKVIELLNVY